MASGAHPTGDAASPDASTVDVDGRQVRLTSGDREVFPGITKREVLDYYLSVSDRLLTQVAGRPTALERWPQGVGPDREHFYSKHLPRHVPSHVRGIDVRFPSGRTGRLLDPDSRAALAWAVQMGTITFHAWPVSAPDVEHPDQLRIDIDPSSETGFDEARRIAETCRELLQEWSWTSFAKTSGGRGLHVFVPILARHTFVEVRHAAIAIGREIERRLPDLVTMSWWKEERGAKVFIDFNQNAQDRVMASAYSLRPTPQATVSMPVDWSDLDRVQPTDFTLRTVPALVTATLDPWAAMSSSAVDLAPAVELWEQDCAAGLGELPYPPDFPKMPGEPPRVQPSRARR